MQTLKLIQKEDGYDNKLKFLLEFIHKITLATIPSNSIIKLVQNELKKIQYLRELEYDKEGLRNQKRYTERFAAIKKEKTDRIGKIYIMSPHFSLLNRTVSLLYEDAIKRLGEKSTNRTFKNIYQKLKQKYAEPDLEGYIPNAITGKAAAAAAAAFGTKLVDNMLHYIIKDVIKKRLKTEVRTIKPERNMLEGGQTGADSFGLNELISQIEQDKKLPIEERDYIRLYLLLEDYITKSQWPDVKQHFTKEELRTVIKKEFNTLLFPPDLSIVFNMESPGRFIFSDMLLKETVKEMSPYIDIRAGLKNLDVNFVSGRPDFETFEKKVLYLKDKDTVVKETSKTLFDLYNVGKATVGEEKTKEIFTNVFKKFKKKYAGLSIFIDVVKQLPQEIFAYEIRKILAPQTAAAEEATTYSAKNFLDEGNLNYFLQKIEQANTLPTDQQEEAFFNIYKDMERFILENRPLTGINELSVEQLRQNVRLNVNIDKLGPKFQILFFGKGAQLIKLVEDFVDEFISVLDMSKKIDVLDLKKNICNRIPLLRDFVDEKGNFVQENIMEKLEGLSEEDKERHIYTSFSEYIRFFYQKSIELYDSSRARSSLKQSYDSLQEKYSELSSSIFPMLPEELLNEKEKFQILEDSYKDFARILVKNTPENFKKELLVLFKETMEKVENKKDEVLLQKEFSRFFELVANTMRTKLGQEETERIFENVYGVVKKVYGAYPIFMQILKAVPRGILEIERFNTLSKEELEKVSKAMKRTEVMKSEFTNIAAHELKTPIVPIKGFLSMMIKNPKKYGLNKKALEYINICLKSAARLENLVTDILDVSKLETGEMKFEMEEVDLSKLLRNEIKELSFLSKKNNLTLKLKIPKTILVYGDSQRLLQAINNLIKNAIKFTEKGSVTVTAKITGDEVQIDIADTGIGIMKEDKKKLFTKFFQGQDITTRKTKGTGLGLAISKEIIEKHKGKIWAESKGLGKGSTFSFSLPVKPETGKTVKKAV